VVSAADDGVAGLQGYWRRHGAGDLTLKPVGSTGEHAFTVLTGSFDGVPVPAGRDLSAAPEAAEVLGDSQYTGALAVSRAYVLLKDRSLPAVRQQLSFRFAVPVYRIGGVLRGWVTMGVHGSELLTETIQAQTHGAVTAALGDPSDALARQIAGSSGDRAQAYPAALDRVLRRRQVETRLREHELELETAEQAAELRRLGCGCGIGQGYLFAKPLPAPQLLELLAGRGAVIRTG
jgi:hypothetical protein